MQRSARSSYDDAVATAARRHRDVLIAGLIVFGSVLWLSVLAFPIVEPDRISRALVWCLGAFIAANVARRTLVLDVGDTAIAGLVSSAIVMGLFLERQNETIDVDMLVPISLAGVGAAVGALTSRRRGEAPRVVWLVLASGLGALGSAIMAGGCVGLVAGNEAATIAIFAGGVAGSCLIALVLEVEGWHFALGAGGSIALAILPDMLRGNLEGIVAAVVGAFVGAIGGAIGERIRSSRKPAPELPPAELR